MLFPSILAAMQTFSPLMRVTSVIMSSAIFDLEPSSLSKKLNLSLVESGNQVAQEAPMAVVLVGAYAHYGHYFGACNLR